jgi:hypothetical protein
MFNLIGLKRENFKKHFIGSNILAKRNIRDGWKREKIEKLQ